MDETLIDGRYLLGESLGRGGEAQVFRARDTAEGGDVALRLGHGHNLFTEPASLPAFYSGWVQFLRAGVDPERGSYQIFELLVGETLRQRVETRPLEPEEWIAFVRQSLDSVGALHTGGWLHGDLHADNFMRLKATPPNWKLLELPFLRFAAPARRSTLFGSIHTLTPEQLQGAAAEPRSDLYALGCLYYYAATGEYPHAAPTAQEIAIHRLRFPAAPLAERAPHLPAAWCAAVMALLEREPRNRPSSAAAAHQLLAVA